MTVRAEPILVDGDPVRYDLAPNYGGSFKRYIEQGTPTGDFLRAVLCNDLLDACSRADPDNRLLLRDYALWLYRYAPPECWGSREKVDAWKKKRRALFDASQ